VSVDAPDDIARIMHAKWQIGLRGGLVVANPIPEAFELPRDVIDDAIASALRDADKEGIAGKALTPYLLARVNALTKGDSLASNIELVRNNARLAANIAIAYAAIAMSG
jgi:pseudouridine-5'-phosphate glycosidase